MHLRGRNRNQQLGLRREPTPRLRSLTGEALIRCGHADLGRIADIDLATWREAEPQDRRGLIYLLSRALAKLGVLTAGIEMLPLGRAGAVRQAVERDVPLEWRRWIERWESTSALTYTWRRSARNYLFKVGRWLAAERPTMTDPRAWNREFAADAVSSYRPGSDIARRTAPSTTPS